MISWIEFNQHKLYRELVDKISPKLIIAAKERSNWARQGQETKNHFSEADIRWAPCGRCRASWGSPIGGVAGRSFATVHVHDHDLTVVVLIGQIHSLSWRWQVSPSICHYDDCGGDVDGQVVLLLGHRGGRAVLCHSHLCSFSSHPGRRNQGSWFCW